MSRALWLQRICLGHLSHVPRALTGAHMFHVKVGYCIPSFCPLAALSALLTKLSSGVLPGALRRWYTFDMLPLSGKRPSCSCIRRTAWFFDSCCSCSALSLDRSLEASLDRLLKVLNMLFDALVFREEGEVAGGDAGSAGSDVRPIPPSMEDRSMPSRAIGLLMGRSRGAFWSSTAVRLMVSSLGLLPCRGIMVRRSAARVCCMGGDNPWNSVTGVRRARARTCFKRA